MRSSIPYRTEHTPSKNFSNVVWEFLSIKFFTGARQKFNFDLKSLTYILLLINTKPFPQTESNLSQKGSGSYAIAGNQIAASRKGFRTFLGEISGNFGEGILRCVESFK